MHLAFFKCSAFAIAHPFLTLLGFIMKALHSIAIVLVIVGGLNWLLVGAFQYDLVAAIFGDMTPASRIVYVLVGLAAVYALISIPRLIRIERAVPARA